MATRKKSAALPETIFCILEDDGGATYVVAQTDFETFDNGQTIGVYKLVDTGVMRVERNVVLESKS